MKKKLLVKRIFSIIVAVALLVSAVPISLAVQNMLIEETTTKIVREVTELREESVKHFLCEDGSYIAATYSAPVHYKENGEWKEIDNSLSLDRSTLSESGKPTYTTKAGGLSVSIPQSFSEGQKITAQNKGYEIGFGINANQNDAYLKTSASVVELEALSSNTEVVMSDSGAYLNDHSALYNKFFDLMGSYSYSFSTEDLLADLDALYYINLFGDSSSNVAINLESYYNNYSYNRYANFVDGRTKADFVDDVYFYTRNKFTKLGVEVIQWPLYDDSHIITDVQAQAAADAFTDYIWTLL